MMFDRKVVVVVAAHDVVLASGRVVVRLSARGMSRLNNTVL